MFRKPRRVRRNTNRNYADPRYTEWRKAVRKRDNYKCQWPGCSSHTKLHVHHIKRWANYPHLRFNVHNGITLCKYHHDFIKNKEEQYEALFLRIVNLNRGNDV